jgi:hypothetical protein
MNYETTKRIYLEEGKNWNPFKKRPYADFYLEIRHGTSKAIAAIIRPHATNAEGGPAPKIIISDTGKTEIRGGYTVEIPMEKLDFDAVNDLFILGQVKEWSLGPITQETIDNLPERVHEKLVEEVNSLYGGQGPLPSGGGGN